MYDSNNIFAKNTLDDRINSYNVQSIEIIDLSFTMVDAVEKLQLTKSRSETKRIINSDGIKVNDLFDVNNEVVALSDILNAMPKDISWSKRVIDTENNSMTIICQMPGEGNRRHHHPDWNEWWYIVEGEWEWEIEGEVKMISQGDIVFMKKNRKHKITASGSSRAISMAISRSDVAHVYED